jgi:hypothetical protein
LLESRNMAEPAEDAHPLTIPHSRVTVTDSASLAESASTPKAAGDFEAAGEVFERLKYLSKERQERVLRWVSEALGLASHSAPKPSGPTVVATPAPPSAQPAIPDSEEPAPQPLPLAVDIKTYVEEKKPGSGIQFAATVAHYYRFDAPLEERKPTIDADVLTEATRLAEWERLPDPLSTLNNAVTKGYLNRSSRGAFAINTVGENLVARALPAAAADGPKAKAKRAPTKKSKKR